jgi:hypothetical protein
MKQETGSANTGIGVDIDIIRVFAERAIERNGQYGPDYDRNIDTPAREIISMISRGFTASHPAIKVTFGRLWERVVK